MATRLRGVRERSGHGRRRGDEVPQALRWREAATAEDAAWLARLIFDEARPSLAPDGVRVLDLTLSMLTSWRFRVDVAEAALDGAIWPDPGSATPELEAWIGTVFGAADRPETSRLAQLARMVEACPVAQGLAAADLPWSAAALAAALRSAAGARHDAGPEPGPITRLRLIARGVEVLSGVDIQPGGRAGEGVLVSDDSWVEFRLAAGVTTASPVCRLDFGVRLGSGDPLGTLYLSYADAPEGRITLTPRGRMRYAAYVVTAGLTAIRWKPDDAAGTAVFTLLTARAASIASIKAGLAPSARPAFDRLIKALKAGHGPAGNALNALELSRLLTRELGAHIHADRSYAAWIRRHELHGAEARRAWARTLSGLTERPFVSLILRLRHELGDRLEETVRSVLAQTYPHWDLHVLSDTPAHEAAQARLQACVAQDFRIKLRTGDEPTPDLNAVLDEAAGDWVGVLEPGDVLATQALLQMMHVASSRPDARLVYADEDAVGPDGERSDPLMKPDFSPELFLGRDYLGPLVLLRPCEVREAGGWRPAFGAAQGYDLVLRMLDGAGPAVVAHVPEVLCHRAWRLAAAPDVSPALSSEAKARAVREHLARTGRAAQVEPLALGRLRVRNVLTEPPPRVSLVIPTRDRAALLSSCVRSILERSTYRAFEVVIVDNGSVDAETHALLAELSQDSRVRVLVDAGEFNFSRLNNLAVAHCRGEVVGLVNNDIEVISPDWIEEMAGWAVQDGVGCVGALLYYPDGRVQHAGVVLGLGGVAEHVLKGAAPQAVYDHWRLGVVHEVSAVTGACLFVRKALYQAMGGLDEALTVSFNDVDLCLRVRGAGHRNLLTPFAQLHHHESVSRGSELSPQNAARFKAEIELMHERWGVEIRADPFYSPNLSQTSLDYGLRWMDA